MTPLNATTWTAADITLGLRLCGYTIARLAREVRLAESTTRYAVGRGHRPEVRRKVAWILGTSEPELHPERFPPQWRECPPS